MSAVLPYRRARPFALVFELVKQRKDLAHLPLFWIVETMALEKLSWSFVKWLNVFVFERRGCGMTYLIEYLLIRQR